MGDVEIKSGVLVCAGDHPWTRMDAILIVVACLLAVAVLGKDITRGGLADADSSAHLMDGVLIHDWICAGPSAWLHPMDFAERQYGHYPTLGIGAHYPPGFAVVESAFFAVFGISTTTGRLCVAFFGMLLAAGTFAFARSLIGRMGAVLATAVMLTMPATTLWGRQTMLEVPMLAAMVWASMLFMRYLERPTTWRLAAALGGAVFALAFKQTAIALLGAEVLTLCVLAAFGVGSIRHATGAVGAGVTALAAVCMSLDHASAKTVSGYDTFTRFSLQSVLYYARIMRYQTGTVVLVAAAIGAVIAALCIKRRTPIGGAPDFDRLRPPSQEHGVNANSKLIFMGAWLFVAYALATAVSLKVPRFIYVALFPIALFSALTARFALGLALRRPVRTLACVAALFCLIVPAVERPVRHSPEFGEVVAAHRDAIQGRAVLFNGLRDGDFVFAVREQLGVQKSIVVRGSKLLYTCTAGPAFDLVSYAQTPDDVRNIMRRFAFETIVIERPNRVGTREDAMFRDYLRTSGDYVRIAQHQLCSTPGSDCNSLWVDIYRLDKPLERQVQVYDIPMPRTGHAIRVDLREVIAHAVDPA